MTRVDLENDIAAWLVAATTKKVIIWWPGKPRPVERPYFTVRIASVLPFGIDESLELSAVGVQRFKGTRIATVDLGAYGSGSLDALELARQGAYKETCRDLLTDQCISIFPPGQVNDLTKMLETDPEERGNLEVRFAFAEEYYDDVGLIEHVTGTGKLYLPDGSNHADFNYKADIPDA